MLSQDILARINLDDLQCLLSNYREGIGLLDNIKQNLYNLEQQMNRGYINQNMEFERRSLLEKMNTVQNKLNSLEGNLSRMLGGRGDLAGNLARYFLQNNCLPMDLVNAVSNAQRQYSSNVWSSGGNYGNFSSGGINPRIRSSQNSYGNYNTNSQYSGFDSSVTYSTRMGGNKQDTNDSDYIPMYSPQEQSAPKKSNFNTSELRDDVIQEPIVQIKEKIVEVIKEVEKPNELLGEVKGNKVIYLEKGKEMDKKHQVQVERLPYSVLIEETMKDEEKEMISVDTFYDPTLKALRYNLRYDSRLKPEIKNTMDKIEIYNVLDPSKETMIKPVKMLDNISITYINKEKDSKLLDKFNPGVYGKDSSTYLASLITSSNRELTYTNKSGEEVPIKFGNYNIEDGKGVICIHTPSTAAMTSVVDEDYEEPIGNPNEFGKKLATSISNVTRELSNSSGLENLFMKLRLLSKQGKLFNKEDIAIPKDITTHIIDIILKALNDTSSKTCMLNTDLFFGIDENSLEGAKKNLMLLRDYFSFEYTIEDFDKYVKYNIIDNLYQIISSIAIEKVTNEFTGNDNETYKKDRLKIVYNITDPFTILICNDETSKELYDWYIGNDNSVVISDKTMPGLCSVLKSCNNKIRNMIRNEGSVDFVPDKIKFNIVLKDIETGRTAYFVAHPMFVTEDREEDYYVLSLRR